jgi:hypothetical protein
MNIIAQLQGGLGNQLFQYAAARSLALRHQAPLLLDQSWFTRTYDDVTPRDPLLSLLQTKGSLIAHEPAISRPKRIRRIAQCLLPISPYIYLERTPYRYDPSLERVSLFRRQNLYLMGYWQSYRYFESIRPTLQSEIKPRSQLDPHYQAYLKQIQPGNAALVHVRRGDYVHLASAAKVHGFLGLDYYQRGMDMLLKRNPNLRFFVFSDDLAWAQENLPHQNKITFITSLESSDAVIQELELMTHCNHFLIANSSLSWWAAWLAKAAGSPVFCPKQWTTDSNIAWDDLLPPHWQRI